MKKTFFLFLILPLTLTAQDDKRSLNLSKQIDSLIISKNYFEARRMYLNNESNLIEFDKLLLGASLDNVFNKLESSNKKIATLFSNYKEQLTDSSWYSLLNLQQINYSKLYEYANAYKAASAIVTNYSHLLTEDEKQDLANTNKIWEALANQPKQEVIIKQHTVLKLKKDKAGLMNLEARTKKKKIDFIFDTGANISTVTETTAKKFNMKVLDAVIDVTAITGTVVPAHIAVCPEFSLGEITIKNAVFLVFPDEALAVKQIKYQINGIIGFPVIEAMKEIQITKNKEFIVPITRSASTELNMALDFLTPIICLNNESYSFDSGADETMLYNTYYKKHKSEIDGKFKETDYQFGGVGGSVTKKGYFISFTTTISTKQITLDKIIVLTEKIKDNENPLYGNVGQDVIKKFDKMTLNFEEMFIRFD